ncbi:MAG TPA: methyltransferase [Tepidisphaeraceae bacterium]|jgi:ubiquinone/menaquinone biosynthesis C-methylase UbiE|nr:methyltransferase [Tepidisphaeraceae bacterium]
MSENAGITDKPTPQRLMQIAWGYAAPLIIETAIRHKVFDQLSTGAKTAEQVAQGSGAAKRGIAMLLNALTALELVAKDVGGKYALTAESDAFLVTTKPSFQGGIFKHLSGEFIPKWLKLTDVVKSGKPALEVNDQETGAKFFEQLVEDIFPMSYAPAQVLGDHLKLAASTKPLKVLDIASGSGVWGIALAQKSPNVKVSAVDWPGVLPVTKRTAQKHGVLDRFDFIEGDINETNLGSGYDVATLGHILHSEGEARSRKLLKRVFDALAPGGTIAIAEFLANDNRSGPPMAMIFAINMLINTDVGDTFTFPEISQWLQEVGFTNTRQLDGPGPSPLILATKPK